MLALSVSVVAVLLVSGGSARKPSGPITVPTTLQPALQALRQRMLKSGVTKPHAVHAPTIQVPSITGYSCPAAAGSPCGRRPCTVYATPGSGRFALAVPLRSAPCAKALARAIPAMAR